MYETRKQPKEEAKCLSSLHAQRFALYTLRSSLHALRSSLFHTQGSALVLVIVMITLTTTIVGIMLMGTLLPLRLTLKEKHRLQTFYLAEAGIQKTIWLLSGNESKDQFWRANNETIELFNNLTASVSVEEWGGYLRVTSTANYKHTTSSIRVLLGEQPSLAFQQAIFIGGVDYPLVVTGDNRIVGDVTVGPEGVKKGVIKGREFSGDKLVDGRIVRQMKPAMPYFDATILENAITKYQNILESAPPSKIIGSRNISDSNVGDLLGARAVYVDGDLEINLSATGEIIEGPMMINSAGSITISGESRFIGFIELVAGNKIIVKDHVLMKNCILSANQGIEISGQCKISAQLISHGSIVIEGQAELSYPSVIYCRASLIDEKWQGKVSLHDHATVRGAIILSPPKEAGVHHYDETLLAFDKKARVVGATYSSNNTDHRGFVLGSIVTGQFFLYEEPTIYLNWLQDAQIDRRALPENFLLPVAFSERPKLGVLSWEEVKMQNTSEK